MTVIADFMLITLCQFLSSLIVIISPGVSEVAFETVSEYVMQEHTVGWLLSDTTR